MVLERLHKVMAAAGIGSRRYCEELIKAGRVKVDGNIATIGMKVDPEKSQIFVDGKRILPEEKRVCILINKPKGYVSTVRDPQGRPKVVDLVRLPGVRLFPVGRLDYQTSGLLLLTNDGELAYLLTHPKFGIWKTYHAVVKGVPSRKDLDVLRRGVPLPEGKTSPARVKILKVLSEEHALLEISLREGKKRQVRKMCSFVGHPVVDLKRVKLGFLTLDGLRPGEYRFLSEQEIEKLKRIAYRNANSSRDALSDET
ncbi:MAG: pseudouridine synthase [Thermacetogeniaceae bacterium]